MMRQGSQQAYEDSDVAQVVRYGCLEHAHHIRVKEKIEEGLLSSHSQAMDRWLNDPNSSADMAPLTMSREKTLSGSKR